MPQISVSYRAFANGSNIYTHSPVASGGIIFSVLSRTRLMEALSICNHVSARPNDKNTPSVTVIPSLITYVINLRIYTAIADKTFINGVNNNGKVLNKKELYLPVGSTTFTLDG